MKNILGVKAYGHENGVALLSGGRVIAIAEERLDRVKHSSAFPSLSIDYCLKALDIKPDSIDLIAIERVKLKSDQQIKDLFREWDKDNCFASATIEVIGHHDAHAASAFFCSPYNEAAILIYDAVGDQYKNQFGVYVGETDTLYEGRDNNLHQIQKTTHQRSGHMFTHTFGVGKLYSRLCRYINFKSGQEGKMLGRAAYGDDSLLKQFPSDKWYREYKNHVLCNAQFSGPKRKQVYAKNTEQTSFLKKVFNKLRTVKNVLKWKFKTTIRFISNRTLSITYNEENNPFIEQDLFEKIRLPQPPRLDEKLPDKYYSSVAYLGQFILEEIAVNLGKKLKGITNSDNLCIAGGVGLNIDANMNFIKKVGFKNVFVQPAASDTGIALGCALYGKHVVLGESDKWEMKSASLGREYSEDEIISSIKQYNDEIVSKKSDNICKKTAELLKDGNIVGWFQGGAEYGPRALGNRSILCDARDPAMKDTLNKKVKHREMWRPFATSIMLEHISKWFDIKEASPFMLFAANVRPEKKAQIPSVLHVDDTSRLQSITKKDNDRYYNLINEFFKLTSVPIVLNTSFNLAGEPIVETPSDALKCFLSTNMDYLVLGDYLIQKRNSGTSS